MPSRPRARSFDELRAMAVFAKTIDAGSFRAAAKQLGLSPSVVSHHVANLEAALDVALLYRTTRRLTLTDEGRELYEAAREMSAAAERGLERASAGARSPAGRLSVALPVSTISEELHADIAAFAMAHPRVTLAVHAADAPVDLVGGGIDLAIRAGKLADSQLKSKRLFAFARTLVAAPAYADRRGRVKHPRELATWDWIGLRSRPAVASFAGGKVRVQFRARVTADSATACVSLARHGLGVTMAPTAMIGPELDARRLVEVLPAWRLEAPDVYAVWPANAPRSGLALRLVGFIEERARGRTAASA